VTNGKSRLQPNTAEDGHQDTSELLGMAQLSSEGDRESSTARGSTPPWVAESFGRGERREIPPHDGDNLHNGRPPRVSREGHLASADLLQAFEEGDPERAYQAGVRLIEAHRALSVEAAHLRFKSNFGSTLCDRCDGLKAGIGVVATCFQLRQCNYTNFKEHDAPSRVANSLELFKIDPKTT